MWLKPQLKYEDRKRSCGSYYRVGMKIYIVVWFGENDTCTTGTIPKLSATAVQGLCGEGASRTDATEDGRSAADIWILLDFFLQSNRA